MRTNIAPGCECFSLNERERPGARLPDSARRRRRRCHSCEGRPASTPDGYALTQLSYTFGARYLLTPRAARSRPFVEAKLGEQARLVLSRLPERVTAAPTPSLSKLEVDCRFVFGHIFPLSFEANYLLTRFSNGADNRQNELRLSAGLVFHVGAKAHTFVASNSVPALQVWYLSGR